MATGKKANGSSRKAKPTNGKTTGSRPRTSSGAAIVKATMPGFQVVKRGRVVAAAMPIPDTVGSGRADAVGSDVAALKAKFRKIPVHRGAGAVDVKAASAESVPGDIEVYEVTSPQVDAFGRPVRSKTVIVSKRQGKIVGFQG